MLKGKCQDSSEALESDSNNNNKVLHDIQLSRTLMDVLIERDFFPQLSAHSNLSSSSFTSLGSETAEKRVKPSKESC